MWEVFSFGYQPYFGVENERVLGGVISGKLHLLCPPACPAVVYDLMGRCWQKKPEWRISAEELSKEILKIVQLRKKGGEENMQAQSADCFQTSKQSQSMTKDSLKVGGMTLHGTAKPLSYVDMTGTLPRENKHESGCEWMTAETVKKEEGYVDMANAPLREGTQEITREASMTPREGSFKQSYVEMDKSHATNAIQLPGKTDYINVGGMSSLPGQETEQNPEDDTIAVTLNTSTSPEPAY